jgi:uncharacterized membrane protein
MRASRKTLLMTILFAISAFTLVGKLLMPTPIQIIIQGEEPIVVGQILSYTQIDVILMTISACLLGISGFYLLFSDLIEPLGALPTVEKIDTLELDVKFAIRLLDGDKRKVFSEIVESGGEILQSELPVRTGFPKAKITRILDYLERKGLLIRKSYGMTNRVIINRNMRMENASKQRI